MLRFCLLAGVLLFGSTGCFYYDDDDCHDRRGRWDNGYRYDRPGYGRGYNHCPPPRYGHYHGPRGRW